MFLHIAIEEFQSKKEMYDHICDILPGMLMETSNVVSNLANASALLGLFLKEVNWVGFYLLKDSLLQLGPFQGKPAVPTIPPGAGVCGTAAAERRTQVVDDVHKCENHIACDISSSSEIVVPLIRDGETIGVLDIDSPLTSRFDQYDKDGLERFAKILLQHI